MTTPIQELQQLRQDLAAQLPERREVIDGALYALLSSESVLLLGPPGTGRSSLVRAVTRLAPALTQDRLPSAPPEAEELQSYFRELVATPTCSPADARGGSGDPPHTHPPDAPPQPRRTPVRLRDRPENESGRPGRGRPEGLLRRWLRGRERDDSVDFGARAFRRDFAGSRRLASRAPGAGGRAAAPVRGRVSRSLSHFQRRCAYRTQRHTSPAVPLSSSSFLEEECQGCHGRHSLWRPAPFPSDASRDVCRELPPQDDVQPREHELELLLRDPPHPLGEKGAVERDDLRHIGDGLLRQASRPR